MVEYIGYFEAIVGTSWRFSMLIKKTARGKAIAEPHYYQACWERISIISRKPVTAVGRVERIPRGIEFHHPEFSLHPDGGNYVVWKDISFTIAHQGARHRIKGQNRRVNASLVFRICCCAPKMCRRRIFDIGWARDVNAVLHPFSSF